MWIDVKRFGGLLLAGVLCGRAAGDGIEAAGDVLQFTLPLSTAGIAVLGTDWPGALEFSEAFVLQGVTVVALRNSVYETPPNGVGHQSFPSGHAAATFTSAEFLRERYGWSYGAPAYGLAAFTGYSRVESENHYWHDVGAGAGLGLCSAWLFTCSAGGWEFRPSSNGHSFGFSFQHLW